MDSKHTGVPTPAAGGAAPFRHRGLIAGSALAMLLTAGVVLAQVLQQAPPAPETPAAPACGWGCL